MGLIQRFLALFSIETKTNIVYRWHFMFSLIVSPLMLAMSFFMWKAIYASTGPLIQGYTFESMISYYVVVLITGHFIYNNTGNELQEKILYGDLTTDLLRPAGIMTQMLATTFSSRALAFFLEVIPVALIALILFPIRQEAYSVAFFAIALILSFLLNFLVNFFVGGIAFWLSKIDSLQWLVFIVARFLSGEFVPLEFLGQAFQYMKLLPFYYLRYGPAQIFLGNLQGYDLISYFVSTVIWVAIMAVSCRLMLKSGLRRYGGIGG